MDNSIVMVLGLVDGALAQGWGLITNVTASGYFLVSYRPLAGASACICLANAIAARCQDAGTANGLT